MTSVCVCICVCVLMCVQMQEGMLTCINIMCLPQLLSTLIFETESLTEPEVVHFSWLTGQHSPRALPVSTPPALQLQIPIDSANTANILSINPSSQT